MLWSKSFFNHTCQITSLCHVLPHNFSMNMGFVAWWSLFTKIFPTCIWWQTFKFFLPQKWCTSECIFMWQVIFSLVEIKDMWHWIKQVFFWLEKHRIIHWVSDSFAFRVTIKACFYTSDVNKLKKEEEWWRNTWKLPLIQMLNDVTCKE